MIGVIAHHLSRRKYGIDGLSLCLVPSDMHSAISVADSSNPKVARFVEMDPGLTARIVGIALLISRVLNLCAVPKIRKSIVGAVAVYVINAIWPFTMGDDPRYAMGLRGMAPNRSNKISAFMAEVEGRLACASRIPTRGTPTGFITAASKHFDWTMLPSQDSRRRVVAKQLSQEIG